MSVEFLEEGMDAVGSFSGARNQQFHPLGLGGDDLDRARSFLTEHALGDLDGFFRAKGLIEIVRCLLADGAKHRFRRVVAGHYYDLWARRKSSSLGQQF